MYNIFVNINTHTAAFYVYINSWVQ